MRYKVYLNDYYDITDKVLEFPLIKESLIGESDNVEYKANFKVDNRNEWVSDGKINDNSIMAGTPINYYTINIKDTAFNTNIYKGTVTWINEFAEKHAEIVTKSIHDTLTQEIKKGIIRSSLFEISAILRSNYNVNINSFSWQYSSLYLQNALLSIIASSDNPITIIDLLKELSEKLGLFIYICREQVYCYPIYMSGQGYKVLLKSSQVLSIEISKNYDDIRNNYEIKYYLNNTVTDDNRGVGLVSRNTYGENAISIDGSSSSNVVIPNASTAVLIGESYLNRYMNPFEVVTFDVEMSVSDYIALVDILYIEPLKKRYTCIDKEYDFNLNKCRITAWEIT